MPRSITQSQPNWEFMHPNICFGGCTRTGRGCKYRRQTLCNGVAIHVAIVNCCDNSGHKPGTIKQITDTIDKNSNPLHIAVIWSECVGARSSSGTKLER